MEVDSPPNNIDIKLPAGCTGDDCDYHLNSTVDKINNKIDFHLRTKEKPKKCAGFGLTRDGELKSLIKIMAGFISAKNGPTVHSADQDDRNKEPKMDSQCTCENPSVQSDGVYMTIQVSRKFDEGDGVGFDAGYGNVIVAYPDGIDCDDDHVHKPEGNIYATKNPIIVAPTCDRSPAINARDSEFDKYFDARYASFSFSQAMSHTNLNLCLLSRFKDMWSTMDTVDTADHCQIAALPISSMMLKESTCVDEYLSTKCHTIGSDANGKTVYEDDKGYTYKYVVDQWQGPCYVTN